MFSYKTFLLLLSASTEKKTDSFYLTKKQKQTQFPDEQQLAQGKTMKLSNKIPMYVAIKIA
jgi:hypothetical protein